jgi:oligosaccharyltransferase complex subunit beta
MAVLCVAPSLASLAHAFVHPQVPDVYGVFKYVLDYSHQGYSHISLQQVVPVRPYKHDEYERFLLAAYPYYASVLSTMTAFFLLGWAFLYSK